ncbi:APC family permease [Mobilicoccus pelagius]|uniref:Putative amino acid transporter n=1 Tax=Mobilicoccus pelagius NBRC 104925 TaxID=1089455 RepID=H5UPM7_9MICO|nr:APC family permease [Mobilicoccus pelagius]GAB47685.1 putative amino acid transporter [Mobilicoccus pelagius NBRC 104925]
MSTPPVPPAPHADRSLEDFGYTQELHRSLTFTDLLVYGLIFMVPIAPFGIFGSVYQSSGGMVALTYAVGMIAMMFTANSYAQMSQAFPMAGSVYTYAGRGFRPWVGFLAGWVILLDYVLIPALLYLVASVAMTSIVPGVPVWAWLIGFVALNTAVNYLGIEMTAKVNKLMLAAELVILAIFLVTGVVAVAQGKGTGFSFTAFFNPHTFTWPLVLGAVSMAVLSFLGFDGISMLAEENKESSSTIGRAMVAALLLAGVLFIVQTWVASMLVPNGAAILSGGDPGGTAFYDAARVGGGAWLAGLTALATAIAWGFANSLVAQAATSRLLYAMARDRQLPAFLATVSERHGVPVNATFVTAAVSLVVGLTMAAQSDGITLLGTLVNFGALSAFLVLHLSVVNHFVRRQGSRDWLRHLVFPLIGFAILLFVVINAKVAAQALAFAWLALGVVVLLVFKVRNREPQLAGMEES